MIDGSRLPDDVLDRIQGNAYPGFKKPHQAFMFVQFVNQSDPRGWIRAVRPSISSASAVMRINDDFKARKADPRRLPPPAEETNVVNIAFTFAGLRRLDTPELARFPADFSRDARARARIASDDENDIANWRVGAEDSKADALLILGSDEARDLDILVEDHANRALDHGLNVLITLRGEALGDSREHFGFKDSVSQPVPVLEEPPDGDEVNVRAGEFFLGLPRNLRHYLQDEDGHRRGEDRPDPDFPAWASEGSYLVFRQMEQLVDLFNAETEKAARQLFERGVSELNPERQGIDLFRAKCIGRWPDGTAVNDRPTPTAPEPPANAPRGPSARAYEEDKFGLTTPRFAHIRKAHPRDLIEALRNDLPTDDPEVVNPIVDEASNHRLIRRGITYTAERRDADEQLAAPELGLIFLAYQASIEEQFEFVMRRWVNRDVFPTLNGVIVNAAGSPGQDALVGASQTNPRENREPLYPVGASSTGVLREERISLERFVVMRGGDYFFSPSLRGLDSL